MSLSSMWETRMEFLAFGFRLPRLSCYSHLGSKPVDERVLLLSLSLFQINKEIQKQILITNRLQECTCPEKRALQDTV